MRTPLDFDHVVSLFPEPYKPREIQLQAIRDIVDAYNNGAEFVLLEVPVGGGKSLIAATIGRALSDDAWYLTLTEQLQKQYTRDFAESLGFEPLLGRGKFKCSKGANMTCAEGKHETPKCGGGCPYVEAKARALEAPHTVANFHSFYFNVGMGIGRKRKKTDPINDYDMQPADYMRRLLVMDECFPAGVEISPGVTIETVKVGDLVPSYDEDSRQVVQRKVVRLFRRAPSALVRVTLSDTSTVVCTPEHPFFTERGWVNAIDLPLSNVLKVQHGSETNSPCVNSTDLRRLFHEMDGDASQGRQSGSRERTTPDEEALLGEMQGRVRVNHRSLSGRTSCKLGTDDAAQPDAYAGSEAPNDGGACSSRELASSGSRGERPRDAATASVAVSGFGAAVGDGSHHPYGENTGSADSFQSGPCEHSTDVGGRSGREFAQGAQPPSRGPAQGGILAWVGVDRVEVLEPGSDGRFGGLCPTGQVYNIEVEGTHTYFANGVTVHNCHVGESFLLDQVGITVKLDKLAGTISKHFKPLPYPNETADEEAGPYLEYVKNEVLPAVREYVTRSSSYLDPKTKDELNSLIGKLTWATQNPDIEWIPERSTDMKTKRRTNAWFSLKPLRVASWGPQLYGAASDFKLFMSGTILDPATFCRGLGLDHTVGEFFTYDSPFPVENRPIWAGDLDMTFNKRDEVWPVMVKQVEALMESHPNQKGLLLCPSNAMLDYIEKGLNYKQRSRLIRAAGEDRTAEYQRHMQGSAPSVLAASGYWEGADLKGSASEFQIIPSVPRPIWQGQIKARAMKERAWYAWITWAKMLQGLGRSVRSETDKAVTYVLDRDFKKELLKKNSLIPKWVASSVKIVEVPEE